MFYLQKWYPHADICKTIFDRSVNFLFTSICFTLFEVTFLLQLFRFSSKYFCIIKSIIVLVNNFSISVLISEVAICLS